MECKCGRRLLAILLCFVLLVCSNALVLAQDWEESLLWDESVSWEEDFAKEDFTAWEEAEVLPAQEGDFEDLLAQDLEEDFLPEEANPALDSEAALESETALGNETDWVGTDEFELIPYLDRTGEAQDPVSCFLIQEETSVLRYGWYAVKGEVHISHPLVIDRDVNLILTDGCKLYAEGGIFIKMAEKLCVYAQSTGEETGCLEASEGSAIKGGIGGDPEEEPGDVYLFGGRIIASGNPAIWASTMIIGAEMRVQAGEDKGSLKSIPVDERVLSCGAYSYAQIEPCPHPDEGKYYFTAYQYHIRHCKWCHYTSEREAHTMENGRCSVCGYDESSGLLFLDSKGEEQRVSDWKEPAKVMESGFYAVTEDCTINDRIEIRGNVSLLLCDDAALYAKQGIFIPAGSALFIYGQKEEGTLPGRLFADAPSDAAGIGGNQNEKGGQLEIYGGRITATGSDSNTAIGAGKNSSMEHILIGGGYIYATGGEQSPGIGSSVLSDPVPVIINGGEVHAKGGKYGAGIGSGCQKEVGDITIRGGSVFAEGVEGGAGIGTSNRTDTGAGTITIEGGYVEALGNGGGAGIGPGAQYSGNGTEGGTVHISGGSVFAFGGDRHRPWQHR